MAQESTHTETEHIPYHTDRQEHIPYHADRQEHIPYHTDRQDRNTLGCRVKDTAGGTLRWESMERNA